MTFVYYYSVPIEEKRGGMWLAALFPQSQFNLQVFKITVNKFVHVVRLESLFDQIQMFAGGVHLL